MSDSKGLAADLLLIAETTPGQERAIVGAFSDLGVVARARHVPPRRGADGLQFLVLAALPVHAFLATLGSTLADRAVQGLRRLVDRVFDGRSEPAAQRSVLVLQDTTTHLQVVLESDLPTDAYQALVTLDLSAFQRGPVHYDRHRGTWRSELDEARRQAT